MTGLLLPVQVADTKWHAYCVDHLIDAWALSRAKTMFEYSCAYHILVTLRFRQPPTWNVWNNISKAYITTYKRGSTESVNPHLMKPSFFSMIIQLQQIKLLKTYPIHVKSRKSFYLRFVAIAKFIYCFALYLSISCVKGNEFIWYWQHCSPSTD